MFLRAVVCSVAARATSNDARGTSQRFERHRYGFGRFWGLIPDGSVPVAARVGTGDSLDGNLVRPTV